LEAREFENESGISSVFVKVLAHVDDGVQGFDLTGVGDF
jgi:hypothetical protein